jgi:hypothetical protein
MHARNFDSFINVIGPCYEFLSELLDRSRKSNTTDPGSNPYNWE